MPPPSRPTSSGPHAEWSKAMVYYEFMTQHKLGQVSRPEMFYIKYFKYFDKGQMFSLN